MQPRQPDPLDDILTLLRSGAYPVAIPMLNELMRQTPKRAQVHYNLGLALSETKQFPEALIALKRCVDLDPEYQPAFVAIGVAYARIGRHQDAKEALTEAINLKPNDGLTLLNLAATLSYLEEREQSTAIARRARQALPNDERTLWNLAQSLKEWAFDPDCKNSNAVRSEASDAYKLFLDEYPESERAEGAEIALTQIAHASLRSAGIGEDGFRPDVFEYILHALKMFEEMGVDAPQPRRARNRQGWRRGPRHQQFHETSRHQRFAG